MLTRYMLGAGVSVVMTFLLFLLMQALIKSDKSPFTDASDISLTEFVRVNEDQKIQVKDRKPIKPPPPDEMPPDAPELDFDGSDESQGIDIRDDGVNVDVLIDDNAGFNSDGEYLPIVKVNPVYPRRAQTRGIEGYVLLAFVVTKTGAVRDPVVLEARPPGMFDRAAISAALKFKYKPKVVNGEPIDVAGVRNRIIFELTN